MSRLSLALLASAASFASASGSGEVGSGSGFGSGFEEVACPTTCFGGSCDDWATAGYSCSNSEDAYACDCSGCECPEPNAGCPNTCFGYSCQTWVDVGWTCSSMSLYGCECHECPSCVSEYGSGGDMGSGSGWENYCDGYCVSQSPKTFAYGDLCYPNKPDCYECIGCRNDGGNIYAYPAFVQTADVCNDEGENCYAPGHVIGPIKNSFQPGLTGATGNVYYAYNSMPDGWAVTTNETAVAICDAQKEWFLSNIDPGLDGKDDDYLVKDCPASVSGSPTTLGEGDLCYPAEMTCYQISNAQATTVGYGAIVQNCHGTQSCFEDGPEAGYITVPTYLPWNGLPGADVIGINNLAFSTLVTLGEDGAPTSTVSIVNDTASLEICEATMQWFMWTGDLAVSPKPGMIDMCSEYGEPEIPAGCPCTGSHGASDGSTWSVAIGEYCAPWDEQYPATYCHEGGTSYGADWCEDDWCYVDPENCDSPYYESGYFPSVELYFSYKACDADFAGNTWVGFCECTGNDGASDGSSWSADIGEYCDAWDAVLPATYCLEGGTSYGADWCDDEWCYVDPEKCDLPTYESTYFPDYELYFSYHTCDADFAGNTWVGGASISDGCPCTGSHGASDGSTWSTGIGEYCYPWDEQSPATYCHEGGTSYGADWCEDPWCYVDPYNCDMPVYASSYFPASPDYCMTEPGSGDLVPSPSPDPEFGESGSGLWPDDDGACALFFSYHTCDADFSGNTWVGFGICDDEPEACQECYPWGYCATEELIDPGCFLSPPHCAEDCAQFAAAGCAGYATESTWEPSGECLSTCYGTTCDNWVVGGYSCSNSEDYGCDCSGCDCEEPDSDCGPTCYGYSCDAWILDPEDSIEEEYTCSLLGTYGCDCEGCSACTNYPPPSASEPASQTTTLTITFSDLEVDSPEEAASVLAALSASYTDSFTEGLGEDVEASVVYTLSKVFSTSVTMTTSESTADTTWLETAILTALGATETSGTTVEIKSFTSARRNRRLEGRRLEETGTFEYDVTQVVATLDATTGEENTNLGAADAIEASLANFDDALANALDDEDVSGIETSDEVEASYESEVEVTITAPDVAALAAASDATADTAGAINPEAVVEALADAGITAEVEAVGVEVVGDLAMASDYSDDDGGGDDVPLIVGLCVGLALPILLILCAVAYFVNKPKDTGGGTVYKAEPKFAGSAVA